MKTLQILVPEKKEAVIKVILKELGISFKSIKEVKEPNSETISAMNELKAGKGKKFKNAESLFNSIK
ncbi:hypothetical protein SAMN05421813_1525 [Daejeonella rubra]|uniref:Uncharacterized protein n=1 Tax=Daejeonella rubra TaxID=990371 RepID=A0A1G9Z2E3_9SPHI|nr:hypothetical protein [Daejeonella rubra]SDN15500.1 hypothetical protein SAMN05421813_1525 [Daejeonella rubra]